MQTRRPQHSRILQSSLQPENSHNIPLGKVTARRAEINCSIARKGVYFRYLDGTSAASLRLCLEYVEPAGYKFSAATVQLCLLSDEEGQEPPVVTEHVYPKRLSGQVTYLKEHKEITIKPSIEAMNVSLGEIGHQRSLDKVHHCLWQFQGYRRLSDEDQWTTAQWDWLADKYNYLNELDPPQFCALVLEGSRCNFGAKLVIRARLKQGLWRYFRFRQESRVKRFRWENHEGDDIGSHVASLEAQILKMNGPKLPRKWPGFHLSPRLTCGACNRGNVLARRFHECR